MFCNDFSAVMDTLWHEHKHEERYLFIDSSRVSFKAVLLHNGNKFHYLFTFGFCRYMKESYENMKLILQKKEYNKYKWNLCGDLKVITTLLGL